MYKKIKTELLFSIVTIAFSTNINAQTYTYDFMSGYDGWIGDFADYPLADSNSYQLEYTRTTLPAPLNTSKYALKIAGTNRSDDLFMFIKRKITGLIPNTTYLLQVQVDFASNAPTNAIGVGGPPGEGVTMKAGATITKPNQIIIGSDYRMNIDKGNQSIPGVDMDTIGHIGVSDTTTKFTLINRNNTANLFTVKTDAYGEVWVCIGTDSGFEGRTTLYYNQITLTFTNTLGLDDFILTKEMIVFPNPASDIISVKISPLLLGQNYKITDQLGRIILTDKLQSEITRIDLNEFPFGIYFLAIGENKLQIFKIVKN
jgi:hypothetical protein